MNVRYSGLTLALPRLNFVCEPYVILCIVKLLMFSFDYSILEDFLGYPVIDYVCYNARSDDPIPILANFLLRIFISPDSCTMYMQKKKKHPLDTNYQVTDDSFIIYYRR